MFGQSRPAQPPDLGFPIHYTCLEAHAWGTGGLVDIVDDRVTGALADSFDPASLAAAMRWVLEDPQRRRQLGAAARQRAERLWEPARVAGLYAEVYGRALEPGVLGGRPAPPSLGSRQRRSRP